MIQRIQSVWLLLASAAVFLTIKFPFYSGRDQAEGLFKTVSGISTIPMMILTAALGTCILVTIFLFRQRKIQLRLTVVCIIAEGLLLYLYIRQVGQFSEGNLGLWAILHPVILVLLILALRGIYKDAKLIKESNRIR